MIDDHESEIDEVAMSAGDLAARASAVYGETWQAILAREGGWNKRSVQRWARDGVPKRQVAEAIAAFLDERARTVVTPAAREYAERRDALIDGIQPRLNAWCAAAVAAGYRPGEVIAAVRASIDVWEADLIASGALPAPWPQDDD